MTCKECRLGLTTSCACQRQARNTEIIRLVEQEGLTGVQIGKKFGISNERVRQIYTKATGKKMERRSYEHSQRNCRVCHTMFPVVASSPKLFCSKPCACQYRIALTDFLHTTIREKRCSHCKEVKPVSEFYWVTVNRRLRPNCKKCQNKLSKAWTDKVDYRRSEVYRKYHQQYYKKNRERIRAYYQKNKERRQARWKAYYQKNKERISAYNRERYQKKKLARQRGEDKKEV